MNVAHEKEKLSVTLDKSIVEEIRALSGGRPMSTSNTTFSSAMHLLSIVSVNSLLKWKRRQGR